MTPGNPVPVKISRPTLSDVVARSRLFQLLDSRMAKPVTWVSAPGGSGKSTLVASYLDARRSRCLWYQCDEGDGDLATFFHYLGLAAKQAAPAYSPDLPLLTPEYLCGIPEFTRTYFEALFARLSPSRPDPDCSPGFFLVLDNYQALPADSAFHEMIATGLDSVPKGVRVVVISRSEPPGALARLRARGQLSLVREKDIRFSLEESSALIQGRLPLLEPEWIKQIHEKTRGWAAGIILLLERSLLEGTGEFSAADFEYEGVFDYFAGEIFSRQTPVVQDFLLKTVLLPALSVPLAEQFTGIDSAGRILSTLNRHHFFTERLSKGDQTYQYHPLFRDFLLTRVKRAIAPEALAELQRRAALLLEQIGQLEEAARLFCQARDREGLLRMVLRHAQQLLQQGRNQTLAEWIACLPGEPANEDPWLWYWTGLCSFPMDLSRTRSYLRQALAGFETRQDIPGIYLAWAGIVDTYAYADEWTHLDDCIARFDELRATYPAFPSLEIELIASAKILLALTLRQTDQPQRVQAWFDRVRALLEQKPSFEIQVDTVFCMSVYSLWKGEYEKNAVLLERAEAEIRQRHPSPFARTRILLMKGIHAWITADYAVAQKTLAEGLAISTQSGVHVYDSLLWSFRAAAQMAQGQLEAAGKSLQSQMAALLGMEQALNLFFFHINSAWYAQLIGNPSLAAEQLEAVAAKVANLGAPYYRALWHIAMAQVAFGQGQIPAAKGHVGTTLQLGLSMQSQVMQWYALLIEAYLHFHEGEEAQGLQALQRGLSLGRQNGYVHLEFYQPSVMGVLCAKALEHGIESAYVTGLIRKLGLKPLAAAPAYSLEAWPHPVKIHTLGRFAILKDDAPLSFSGKEQKKPLELLKVLIACGGREVPVERLIDALWPEAEGDKAQKSFEMTLGRLRRLLGSDKTILYRSRQLSLNPDCCWVDSLALGELCERIGQAPFAQAGLLCAQALRLARGPFLPADSGAPWCIVCRELLKQRLLRVIRQLAQQCEAAEDWQKAAEYYVRGLELDPLAEEFHRLLMHCQRRLGNHAEAVRIYQRCRSLLRTELGIDPSPETTSVYTAILAPR